MNHAPVTPSGVGEPHPNLKSLWETFTEGQKKAKSQRKEDLDCFDIKTAEPINVIGEWETMEFTVDSGAAESVVPASSLQTVRTMAGEKSRNGVEYESACGTTIPNEGEKRCLISTADSPTEKMAVLQVAKIGKSLLSVSKMVDKGNTVIFNPSGSFIYSGASQEYTQLRRKGNLYVMDAWVRASGSDQPAPSPASKPTAGFSRPGR